MKFYKKFSKGQFPGKRSGATVWNEFAHWYNEYNKTNMTDLREGETLRVFSADDCREYAENLEALSRLTVIYYLIS